MYVGYSPHAPGTIGSLLGVIICFFLSQSGTLIYSAAYLTSFLTAIWAATHASKYFSQEDPGQIVCDEVAGFMTAMLLIPFILTNVIIVFLLFRIFDIFKPFPINLIDRKMKSGFGIVFDDILAGIYANLTFRLLAQFVA
jgi:phosphatidylglycerophosphatase A